MHQGHSASLGPLLRRLYALGPGRMNYSRANLAQLLELAGHPQLAVPALLVGGTNGKGRLVAALSAALAGRYRTAAFIKPHLKSIRERWRIDDADLSAELFCAAAEETLALIARSQLPISFFEANVLLGALAFRAAGCELAVWEVGLGGQHDACNLTDPLISVLTNVQYDHQALLGETLSQIARDKAQIARPGRPLLLGPARPGWETGYAEYAPVVQQVCAELGAQCCAVPPLDSTPDWATPGLPGDTLALLAALQPLLATAGFPLTADQLRGGLLRLHYRGRMEHTLLDGRPVLLDAAHNADSLRWLGRQLAGQRHPIIFGCQATRDPLAALAELAPVCSVLVPVEVPVLHPCPARRIADAAAQLGLPLSLPPGFGLNALPQDYEVGNVTELDPPDNRTGWIECVRHGLRLGTPGCPAVVCGSIYNLGEILRVFEDGWLAPA